ncbi:MAG: hypothetical protein PF588_10770 [Candidatus Kapabacteria bacterium]|nr:hypothetical protein [Candidatus Kapabacteria bacterium]
MQKWTIKWTNEVKIKIFVHIGILIKIDLFYDEKQAVYTQYKQTIRFGVIAGY